MALQLLETVLYNYLWHSWRCVALIKDVVISRKGKSSRISDNLERVWWGGGCLSSLKSWRHCLFGVDNVGEEVKRSMDWLTKILIKVGARISYHAWGGMSMWPQPFLWRTTNVRWWHWVLKVHRIEVSWFCGVVCSFFEIITFSRKLVLSCRPQDNRLSREEAYLH